MRRPGTVSQGKASVIWRASHSAVGLVVTPIHRRRRRPSPKMTNTNSRSNASVGTMRKSTHAIPSRSAAPLLSDARDSVESATPTSRGPQGRTRLRYPDNEGLPDAFPLEADSVGKLLNQIGPAILFTHSGSGYPGWLTAIGSPKVKSVVTFEPGTFVWPVGEVPPGQIRVVPLADFLKLTQIPIVIIIGDRYPVPSLSI